MTTHTSDVADLPEALTEYLEAQDALDNREYAGINAEPHEKLVRSRNHARAALESALAAGQATAAQAQPAAQQGAAYAATPTSNYAGRVYEEGFLIGTCPLYTADQLRAFADRTHALRASHGQAPADAAPSAGAVAGPDDIDAIALTRYKVVHSHDSMFHRFAVVAGDGKQQLYLGRATECQNMTRKFAGAFLDGAFYQSQIAAAPTPAAQAADSMQEDAARWHWMAEYIVGTRTDLDDELIASATVDELRKLVDADLATRKQGATP